MDGQFLFNNSVFYAQTQKDKGPLSEQLPLPSYALPPVHFPSISTPSKTTTLALSTPSSERKRRFAAAEQKFDSETEVKRKKLEFGLWNDAMNFVEQMHRVWELRRIFGCIATRRKCVNNTSQS